MGRHRRSAAGRAATGRATGVTGRDGSYASGYDPQQYSYSYDPPQTYPGDDLPTMGVAPYLHTEQYAEASARSAAYLFASEDDYAAVFPEHGFSPDGGSRRGKSRRRRKKAVTPVRTGLLGVSAAVAIGTVAVATGAVPGLDNYKLGGGGSGDKVQAANTPTNSATEQGGTSGSADGRDEDSSTSRDADRSASPSPAPSTSSAAPTEAPTKKPKAPAAKKPKTTPSQKENKPPKKTTAPVTVSAEAAASAQVLKLVNEERAKVGCSAVAANSTLSDLAESFSDAMAADGFFDHTDPSGATPWDRAAKLGITDLGGENIARGQADAAAVMDAWMNSPGHRANILNCDFKTLGVGVHFGAGGPWWTQDFGY
ncbi:MULTISPECIES: CAP domain-containing protein [unclassified Streptomyces]|uniref:CAP domain-containing protein n=1 Tax=unclassified Streptomyces TaxID=2593676 RepID=UPI003253CA00